MDREAPVVETTAPRAIQWNHISEDVTSFNLASLSTLARSGKLAAASSSICRSDF